MSDVIVAFDDYVYGTTAVYSSSFFHALLGELEVYSIEVVVDSLPGTPSGSAIVQVEMSSDGRNWLPRNSSPEITASITAGNETVASAGEVGAVVPLSLLRLKVQLTGSPGTPAARVQAFMRPRPDPRILPGRLAGCAMWLRADAGVSLDGTNGVSSWKDLSSGGHDGSQTTTLRRPRTSTSGINGQPTILFDASAAGSEQYLSLAGSLSLSSAHALLVAKNTNAIPSGSSRSGLWRMGSSGATATQFPFTDGKLYDDFGSNARYNEGTPVATVTNAYLYEVRAIAGSWTSFMNGTSQFTNAANTVAWSSSLEIGGNSAVGAFFDGHVAELAIYDHVLSDAERTLLLAYFNNRYQIGAV